MSQLTLTRAALESAYEMVVRVRYLSSYEGVGGACVSICGMELQFYLLDGLHAEYALNRVSIPKLWTKEVNNGGFPHWVDKCVAQPVVSVRYDIKVSNPHVRGEQKFKIFELSVCTR